MLGEGDVLEQTVEGLQPNMAYTFWAGVKANRYYRIAVTFEDHRTVETWDPATADGFAIYRILSGFTEYLSISVYFRFIFLDMWETV